MQDKTAVGLMLASNLFLGAGIGALKENSIRDGITIAAIGIILMLIAIGPYRKALKKLN